MNHRRHGVCLLACSVFRDALDWLQFDRRFPQVVVHLPSAHLHLRPAELENRLAQELEQLRSSDENSRSGCMIGQCFRGIDEVLAGINATRVPGSHCFETLLGVERFAEITAAQPGSFCMEKQLLLHFDQYVAAAATRRPPAAQLICRALPADSVHPAAPGPGSELTGRAGCRQAGTLPAVAGLRLPAAG